MEIKDWVKNARKSCGWTGAELGERLGRSKGTIGHWETGTHLPSYAQILKIHELTGYPLPNQEGAPQGAADAPAVFRENPGADMVVRWLSSALAAHTPARRTSIGDALKRLAEAPLEPDFAESLLLLLRADVRKRSGTHG